MDGRRLYGPYDATRSLAWGLDVCNGRWEIDGLRSASTGADTDRNRLYAYRATPSFPYLIGCRGPAGISLDLAAAAAAAADTTNGLDSSIIDVGFLVEAGTPEGCPAGSFLSTESGECEACRAGTYGKDAGTVGAECPGVSLFHAQPSRQGREGLSCILKSTKRVAGFAWYCIPQYNYNLTTYLVPCVILVICHVLGNTWCEPLPAHRLSP